MQRVALRFAWAWSNADIYYLCSTIAITEPNYACNGIQATQCCKDVVSVAQTVNKKVHKKLDLAVRACQLKELHKQTPTNVNP
jgi:hypothetical protein